MTILWARTRTADLALGVRHDVDCSFSSSEVVGESASSHSADTDATGGGLTLSNLLDDDLEAAGDGLVARAVRFGRDDPEVVQAEVEHVERCDP